MCCCFHYCFCHGLGLKGKWKCINHIGLGFQFFSSRLHGLIIMFAQPIKWRTVKTVPHWPVCRAPVQEGSTCPHHLLHCCKTLGTDFCQSWRRRSRTWWQQWSPATDGSGWEYWQNREKLRWNGEQELGRWGGIMSHKSSLMALSCLTRIKTLKPILIPSYRISGLLVGLDQTHFPSDIVQISDFRPVWIS